MELQTMIVMMDINTSRKGREGVKKMIPKGIYHYVFDKRESKYG